MTIILQSPDGKFFRRIHPDGRVEKKTLGLEWEAHEPLPDHRRESYLTTMTRHLRWKKTEQP
jgi:hypothetical protein